MKNKTKIILIIGLVLFISVYLLSNSWARKESEPRGAPRAEMTENQKQELGKNNQVITDDPKTLDEINKELDALEVELKRIDADNQPDADLGI